MVLDIRPLNITLVHSFVLFSVLITIIILNKKKIQNSLQVLPKLCFWPNNQQYNILVIRVIFSAMIIYNILDISRN